MSKHIIEKQPEGNYYDKYNTHNKIEQLLMKQFFKNTEICLKKSGKQISSILEAGCGEGYFTNFLQKIFTDSRIDAFDVSKAVIEQATLTYVNINFQVGSVYSIASENEQYDLVVASEVLEHLETPEKALNELLRVSSGYVLITVPHEPIWRILNICRAKYITRWGNTPGHIQHWSKRSIKRFINSYKTGRVVEVRSSLPWIIVLIEKL
jgi:2-polyprenyl-3-methyl-5-hydroxy-6-metoxy-1,4-benzoquinol methylase